MQIILEESVCHGNIASICSCSPAASNVCKPACQHHWKHVRLRWYRKANFFTGVKLAQMLSRLYPWLRKWRHLQKQANENFLYTYAECLRAASGANDNVPKLKLSDCYSRSDVLGRHRPAIVISSDWMTQSVLCCITK